MKPETQKQIDQLTAELKEVEKDRKHAEYEFEHSAWLTIPEVDFLETIRIKLLDVKTDILSAQEEQIVTYRSERDGEVLKEIEMKPLYGPVPDLSRTFGMEVYKQIDKPYMSVVVKRDQIIDSYKNEHRKEYFEIYDNRIKSLQDQIANLKAGKNI